MNAKQQIAGVVALFFAATVNLFAIEDLRIRVDGPDVVLSWPSAEGETYIVQYRGTLETNDVWQTLTNDYSAFSGTNWTTIVHTDAACYPDGGSEVSGGGSGGPPSPESVTSQEDSKTMPAMVMRKDGSVTPVPLSLYPPGFDLSGFLILWPDESVDEWTKEFQQTYLEVFSEFGGSENSSSSESACYSFYRVVRNLPHFYGITNGITLSGIVELRGELGLEGYGVPLDFGLSPDDEVPQPPGVQIYAFTGTNDVPLLLWNTHLAPNGTYTLSPMVLLAGGATVTGNAVTVTVSNAIQVPFFHEFFGTGLPIAATIASNNAPYEITIRDEVGNVIRTLIGTANGFEITNYWDGLDEFGNSALTNDFVSTTISYNPAYRGTNWIEKAGNIAGQLLVCYQDSLFSFANQVVFENNMQQIVTFGTDHGGVVTGGRFEIGTGSGDWNTLYTHVTQARNIYYYGHGGPNTLGYGSNDPNNGTRASAIQSVLRNRFLKEDFNIRHPFRFVFLDGCQTGSKSSEWPTSFGIMPKELTGADFATLGLPNRAFVGWKKNIVTTAFETTRHTFVLRFFDNWMEGRQDLIDALTSAATGTIGSGEVNKLQIWGDRLLQSQ